MINNTPVTDSTDKLLDYHLGKVNHQPTGCTVALTQTGLMTCALVGLLYAIPAYQYRKEDEERYLDVVGTCHMAVLICYVAADMFFRMHLAKQWPDKELEGIISAPLTNDEFWRQNIIIGICAAVSAGPYVTTAYTNPPPDLSFGWLLAYSAFVLVTEAILHFLSVKLTLVHPFYGFLPRTVSQLCTWSCGHKKSTTELEKIEESKKLKTRQLYLEQKIKGSSRELLASFLPSLGEIDTDNLTQFLNKTPTDQFATLLSIQQPIEKPWPFYIEIMARVIGALTVLSACLGYAANPFLLFMDKTGSWWEALLTTFFPLYFFGVLLAYFGDEYGIRMLNDFDSLVKNIGHLRRGEPLRLPLICRLYPMTTSFLIFAINIPLLVYSPAAASEMTKEAFESVVSEQTMTALQVLVKLGTFILAWYAPLDFQLLMLKYATQYLGTGDIQKIVLLAARIETLAEDMMQLNKKKCIRYRGTYQTNTCFGHRQSYSEFDS
ncbi:MAG: hypothetical protein LRY67_04470 [Gammaproteobacteria bacterium]|nr:hypothetical protein [Gammaproteobacteria bacterium]